MDSCSLSSFSDLGKLFIGGISWDTDEDRLREYFQNYGEVVEAVIMKDRTTGRARGFGFVVFADPAAAERVVMDKHVIDGRTVEAKKAVPREDHQHILCRSNSSSGTPHASPGPSPARTKKIFVGGLASTVTEADFKSYFDQFGNITDVVVMYDHNTQRPRGFGFITYDSEDAVDKVLLKTFHELNGKMVEVKRAVPKELSPGPTFRSPLGVGVGGGGYNSYTLNRINSYLGVGSGYVQGYNPSSIGGFGMRTDGRSFGNFASGRNALSSFGPPAYGMGVNFEPGLNPTYGGNTNFTNNLGYGRELNPPYYTASSTRFSPTIGYGGSNGGNSSVISSMARDVWGNGSFDYLAVSANPSASGNLGGFGNSGLNWGGSSPPISSQRIGSGSGYGSGNLGFAGGEDNNFQGDASFGRRTATAAATNSFTSSSGGFDGNYADTYGGSSVYGDLTWRTTSSEIDRSGPFGYGLGNVSSDVTAKDSSGYMGGYNVTSRQSNRDIVTFENELF